MMSRPIRNTLLQYIQSKFNFTSTSTPTTIFSTTQTLYRLYLQLWHIDIQTSSTLDLQPYRSNTEPCIESQHYVDQNTPSLLVCQRFSIGCVTTEGQPIWLFVLDNQSQPMCFDGMMMMMTTICQPKNKVCQKRCPMSKGMCTHNKLLEHCPAIFLKKLPFHI